MPLDDRNLSPNLEKRLPKLDTVARLRLLLDYDGTLADFAPTPDVVEPDPELVALLRRLARLERIRAAVISGRRLAHVQRLVPVPGILLAGTYGIELQTPDGRRLDRLDYDAIRPALDTIKPHWAGLIGGESPRSGFYLEDKGWSLALHARFAEGPESDRVLAAARRLASAKVDRAMPGLFRLLGGDRFLEISPQLANKGLTVAHLLTRYPWEGALPIYLGDDDKDEEAFAVIKTHGGIAIVVASEPRETKADLRLASPHATRQWLEQLLIASG